MVELVHTTCTSLTYAARTLAQTVSIGGMATVLNTSGGPIFPGDMVEWAFCTEHTDHHKRSKLGPRRVAVQVASVSSPKIIGRALSVTL